jgi:hypothetical protein
MDPNIFELSEAEQVGDRLSNDSHPQRFANVSFRQSDDTGIGDRSSPGLDSDRRDRFADVIGDLGKARDCSENDERGH